MESVRATPNVSSSSPTSDDNSNNTETNKSNFEDPVNKAVVDNIMGRLPAKKNRVTLHCDLCKLEFYSQITLDMHLRGAKHAKKLKSIEIIQNLQEEGQTFQPSATDKQLRCDICQVVVNSTHQLQTHLAGTKHRQKLMKRNAPDTLEEIAPPGVPAKKIKKFPPPEGKPVGTEQTQKMLKRNVPDTFEELTPPGVPAKKIKKFPPPEGKPIGFQPDPPAGVRQVTHASFTKSGKFHCETCGVSLNSEIQLHQHANSKKHMDKLKGTYNVPKNFSNPHKSKKLNSLSDSTPATGVARGTPSSQDSYIRGGTMA